MNNPVNLVDPSGENPLLILAAISFLAGVGVNTWMQYQANNGWCGFDPLAALQWGISAAFISTLVALSVLQAGALLGMGLQGIGVLFNFLPAFSVGSNLSAAAGAATVWFMTGKRYLPAMPRRLNLPFKDSSLKSQIRSVVTSFDEAGKPPPNVVQGLRNGGIRGTFYNEPRVLPSQPLGYYNESDIWPFGSGGRGAERIILGKAGEVFYTNVHYEKGSIVQIR